MCVCVSACAKRKCKERMQIDLGPLTSTCINFAAIVIWPRNANAAKAFQAFHNFTQITRKPKETETGNASLSQVYWMCLKSAHTMCFCFLGSVYSSAKSTVNSNNKNKKKEQQQQQHRHRSISNSSKTTYEDETFILNLLPNLLGDTA